MLVETDGVLTGHAPGYEHSFINLRLVAESDQVAGWGLHEARAPHHNLPPLYFTTLFLRFSKDILKIF